MKRTYSHEDFTWEVDLERCAGSSECVQACPMKILIVDDDEKSDCTDITKCISCCACVNACPEDAITHTMCG